jgi:hypothetical protein
MKRRIDITDKIGSLYNGTKELPEWPMYSFDRPAYYLWNAIANGLHQRGWTEEQIKDWLQSKSARWALDGSLGESIEQLGAEFAAIIVKDMEA